MFTPRHLTATLYVRAGRLPFFRHRICGWGNTAKAMGEKRAMVPKINWPPLFGGRTLQIWWLSCAGMFLSCKVAHSLQRCFVILTHKHKATGFERLWAWDHILLRSSTLLCLVWRRENNPSLVVKLCTTNVRQNTRRDQSLDGLEIALQMDKFRPKSFSLVSLREFQVALLQVFKVSNCEAQVCSVLFQKLINFQTQPRKWIHLLQSNKQIIKIWAHLFPP